ncbi:MAG: hypothetical protein KDA24_13645 [Deltaproteobacteria bacterium]|nr:hypothetical protein [Deltaproteobacteria bacterium]
MAQARIRRRGGLVPRLIFAFVFAFLVLEVGLRFLLGNGGHGLVVRPARNAEVCWELVPSSTATYTGDATRQGRSSIHVNALGARSPEPSAEQERLRIVVLGDGLVFGHGVDDDETLASRLSQGLAARGHANDMLSLGVPGLSPAQSVATFERRVRELKPQLAVLLVSPDDLDRDADACPHDGVVQRDGTVSSLAAREQLRTLVSSRSYTMRALRLVRTAGWPALLDANGPYGPGREPLGRSGPPSPDARADARHGNTVPPGPWFAQTRTTPKELWGDVPILLPQESDVPTIVPRGKQEYVFVEAVQRLARVGLRNDVQIAVVVVADRSTFQRVSDCRDCRPPQSLLTGVDVRRIDLAGLWLQLLRRPEVYFQRGEGFPNAAGHEELGRALAGELASSLAL